MLVFFWFLSRAFNITGIFLLLIGWYSPGVIFLLAWVVTSLIWWLLIPLPDDSAQAFRAHSDSLELANDYWEASEQMVRAAQHYGFQK